MCKSHPIGARFYVSFIRFIPVKVRDLAVCMSMHCVLGAHRDQKMSSDPLEMKLEII